MKGRTALRKLATVAVAVMLISGGIATVNPHTEQDLSPVGEGDAALVTGAALVGAAAAGAIAGAAVTCHQTDCLASRDPDVGEKQETSQTKIDLYQTANQQESVREVIGSIGQNGIRSSDAKMKMEAIQALSEAADRGMSLSEAKTHVSQTVNNRSTIKQINLLNAWSNSAETLRYIENRSDVAPNIGDGFANIQQSYQGIKLGHIARPSFDLKESGDWTRQITLHNGSTHNITVVPMLIKEGMTNRDDYSLKTVETKTHYVYPGNTGGTHATTVKPQSYPAETMKISYQINQYVVDRPSSAEADNQLTDSGNSVLVDGSTWTNLTNQVTKQKQDVIQTVHSIADRKYSAIKAGEIKLPTNQNPYYASEMGAANNYSSEAFTASWLSSQGVANPEDWQNLESATIKTDDGRYLIGQPLGLPNGTTIREGNNYSVANTGPLTVATKDGVKRINSGNYSVSEINGTRGKNISSLTFERQDLSVSNISEYRRAVDWMQEQQAESEAREQTVEQTARKSGGGLLPSGLGLDSPFSGESAVIGMILLGIALLSIVARIATGSN